MLSAASLARMGMMHTSRAVSRGVVPRAPLLVGPPRTARTLCHSTPSAQQHPQQQQPAHAHAHLTAADKLAIIELVHRFDHLINQGQQQALGDLFASDAEVHHPKGVTKGAGSLVDYFIACRPMAQGNRHLTLNILLHDIDAAAAAGAGEPGAPPPRRTARASSYRLLHRASNPPALLASGTIEDEFVMEEGGGWRFARRRFVMDPPAAPPAQ